MKAEFNAEAQRRIGRREVAGTGDGAGMERDVGIAIPTYGEGHMVDSFLTA